MDSLTLGLSTWLYENRPLTEALVKISRAGFREIELWGDTHWNPRLVSESEFQALTRQIQDIGLTVHSLHAPFRDLDLGHPDPQARQDAVETVRQSIRQALPLHPRVIVLHPGNCTPTDDRAEHEAFRAHVIASVRQLQELVQSTGTRLAVENMIHGAPWKPKERTKTYQFGWSVPQLMEIVRAVPGTGVCLDLGHAQLNRVSWAEFFKTAPVISFHLHDNDGIRDWHWVPGKGILRWNEFWAAFHQTGLTQGLILEVSGQDDPDARLQECREVAGKMGSAEK